MQRSQTNKACYHHKGRWCSCRGWKSTRKHHMIAVFVGLLVWQFWHQFSPSVGFSFISGQSLHQDQGTLSIRDVQISKLHATNPLLDSSDLFARPNWPLSDWAALIPLVATLPSSIDMALWETTSDLQGKHAILEWHNSFSLLHSTNIQWPQIYCVSREKRWPSPPKWGLVKVTRKEKQLWKMAPQRWD